MDYLQLAIFLGIGLFSGFMAGMFGIGGGSIKIPLLFMTGMPLLTAYGVNLAAIPFSSAMGAYTQRKNIDWKYIKWGLWGAMAGSILAAFLTGLINEIILGIIFVFAAILTVIGMFFDKISPKISKRIHPSHTNIFTGLFFVNTLIGLRGGSGGTLFTPFLHMMKLEVHRAIATSLFISTFTAIVAALIYIAKGHILIIPALMVILGSVIGSRIGSLISLKTKPLWLEVGLSALVVILAITTLIKLIN